MTQPMTDIRLYTRGAKGALTGVLIATKSTIEGHRYHIGWSKAKLNEDEFNKNFALKIAVGRLQAAEGKGIECITNKMPSQIRKLLPKFQERCNRYFK